MKIYVLDQYDDRDDDHDDDGGMRAIEVFGWRGHTVVDRASHVAAAAIAEHVVVEVGDQRDARRIETRTQLSTFIVVMH